MQDITAMKVPDKYEPKNPDEFRTFDDAVIRILPIPASKFTRKSHVKEPAKKRAKKDQRTRRCPQFWRRGFKPLTIRAAPHHGQAADLR
jgi:hypothetical protein